MLVQIVIILCGIIRDFVNPHKGGRIGVEQVDGSGVFAQGRAQDFPLKAKRSEQGFSLVPNVPDGLEERVTSLLYFLLFTADHDLGVAVPTNHHVRFAEDTGLLSRQEERVSELVAAFGDPFLAHGTEKGGGGHGDEHRGDADDHHQFDQCETRTSGKCSFPCRRVCPEKRHTHLEIPFVVRGSQGVADPAPNVLADQFNWITSAKLPS